MKTLRKTDDQWVVSTVPRSWPIIGLVLLAFGAAGVSYLLRHEAVAKRDEYGVWCALAVVVGLWFLTYARRLVLDRPEKRILMKTRWFGVPVTRALDVKGDIHVERWTRRSKETGSSTVFDVIMDDEVLLRFGENAGQSEADRWAREMAEFLGASHAPPRNSEAEARRIAQSAKTAAYPLYFVFGTLALGAFVYLLMG